MIRLPTTLPPDVRALFEREITLAPSLAELLARLGPLLLRLFNARDAITAWHSPACHSITRALLPASTDPALSGTALGELQARWDGSPTDREVRKHLHDRAACASFSAFSWPFGSITVPDVNGRRLSVPREYTLLIPIDSDMSVHDENDLEFSGYVALFFDSFPQFSDLPIHLIVVLPEVLSAVLTYTLRKERHHDGDPSLATAHELKRSVLFALDQVEQLRALTPSDLESLLDNLERNLQRMNRAVSRTLLSDRIGTGGLRISPLKLCVNEVIHDVVRQITPLCDAAGLSLRLDLAPDLPETSIDPSLFPAVIENLIENAIKYSAPGGNIFIKTKAEQDTVFVTLLDDGVGIPESEWDLVFNKHYRASSAGNVPGNGLGLFLAKHLIESHGGTIMLQSPSTEAYRTHFEICLPRHESTSVELPQIPEPGEVTDGGA